MNAPSCLILAADKMSLQKADTASRDTGWLLHDSTQVDRPLFSMSSHPHSGAEHITVAELQVPAASFAAAKVVDLSSESSAGPGPEYSCKNKALNKRKKSLRKMKL